MLRAAYEVLTRQGSGGFSLEAVGRQAGVTRLTVHNQFGSRRRLLEALFDERARVGGLGGLPEAMRLDDPEAAIEAVVGVFGRFWTSQSEGIEQLMAAGAAEREFREAIRERNERRRRLFEVLAARLVEAGKLEAAALPDFVDLAFGMTSHPVFAGLIRKSRTPEQATRLVCRALRALRALDADQ